MFYPDALSRSDLKTRCFRCKTDKKWMRSWNKCAHRICSDCYHEQVPLAYFSGPDYVVTCLQCQNLNKAK